MTTFICINCNESCIHSKYLHDDVDDNDNMYCKNCSNKHYIQINNKLVKIIYRCDKCGRCLREFDESQIENGNIIDCWYYNFEECDACYNKMISLIDTETCNECGLLKLKNSSCYHYIIDCVNSRDSYSRGTKKCKHCKRYLSKCIFCDKNDCYVCVFNNCQKSQITDNKIQQYSYRCLNCSYELFDSRATCITNVQCNDCGSYKHVCKGCRHVGNFIACLNCNTELKIDNMSWCYDCY